MHDHLQRYARQVLGMLTDVSSAGPISYFYTALSAFTFLLRWWNGFHALFPAPIIVATCNQEKGRFSTPMPFSTPKRFSDMDNSPTSPSLTFTPKGKEKARFEPLRPRAATDWITNPQKSDTNKNSDIQASELSSGRRQYWTTNVLLEGCVVETTVQVIFNIFYIIF